MSDLDRVVGALRCRDVLALLADYVDGELPPDDLARVEVHLSGCDTCEKFGGEYGTLVGRLREKIGVEPPEPSDVRERLANRMRIEWEGVTE